MAVNKPVKIAIAGCGCLSLLVACGFMFLVYIGTQGPSADVEAGNAITQKQQQVFQKLDLLEGGEKVIYYYSDALLDIEAGIYILTDRRIILHSNTWVTPTWKVVFHNINSVSLERDTSFFADSMVTLELNSGDVLIFPLSSFEEGDVKFVERLQRYMDEVGTHQ